MNKCQQESSITSKINSCRRIRPDQVLSSFCSQATITALKLTFEHVVQYNKIEQRSGRRQWIVKKLLLRRQLRTLINEKAKV